MYYKIEFDAENFANLIPSNNTIEWAETFDGRSHIDNWNGMHFTLSLDDDTRPIPEINIDYMPICSRRVYDAIKTICGDSVEFLPCTVGKDNLEYYIFNILGSIDVVDYDKSKYLRFSPNGRIMFFEKIVFKETVTSPMFRIPDLPYAWFFCNEDMKVLLNKIKPTGIRLTNELFK